MEPHTWPCKSRMTSTNIHSATMWGYRMLSWDLPEAMNDREKRRERVRDIRATSTTWWWWWWWWLQPKSTELRLFKHVTSNLLENNLIKYKTPKRLCSISEHSSFKKKFHKETRFLIFKLIFSSHVLKRAKCVKISIYLYIYLSILKEKNQTGYFRIINLFPSCFRFWCKPKTRRKIKILRVFGLHQKLKQDGNKMYNPKITGLWVFL